MALHDEQHTVRATSTPVGASARLLGVEAARRRLGVGLTMFYELVGRNEIRTVKIGGRRLVSETAIADYIRQT